MTLETLRPELRWAIEAAQNKKAAAVTLLDLTGECDAGPLVEAFQAFDEEFSNWYLRRSRRRFWKSEGDAYQTLYAVLTTAGMTCCRAVRGSTTNYSNHSWGTAIDMSIKGVLTPLGSTTVQEGIAEAAPFFLAERFFWGAGYSSRKDAMHFEASHELIQDWKKAGSI